MGGGVKCEQQQQQGHQCGDGDDDDDDNLNLVVIEKVLGLYEQIRRLESLKPCKDVDMVFTQLVATCMPPSTIDVNKLCDEVQDKRSKLIKLCGEAEGHLESHYSALILQQLQQGIQFQNQNPLHHHLHLFPYHSNYLKLSLLEFNILRQNSVSTPKRVAFVGSGPLPLTSIVLATKHLTTTCFHNYDIDPSANAMALALVSSDPDLSTRMFFHTADIMDVGGDGLKDFDVVFLAALVGMDKEMKVTVIRHLSKHMAPGAILMLRSAHGARGFLYPVVDPISDLQGFHLLSVFHPTDEVINSVVIARVLDNNTTITSTTNATSITSTSTTSTNAAATTTSTSTTTIASSSSSFINIPNNNNNCKCSEIAAFNHRCIMEELTLEEQLS